MPVTVHMVVRNEDRFVWYSLMSVMDYADKIIITDTGSEDKTVAIIRSVGSDKIDFSRKTVKNPEDLSAVRQDQIGGTDTDWIWVVDGDEIYPRSLCEEINGIIKDRGGGLTGIVCGRYDLLGDIYHRQSESVGEYSLLGKKGHIVLRLINRKKVKGLHVEGAYPYEGYFDGNGVQLTSYSTSGFAFFTGVMNAAAISYQNPLFPVTSGTISGLARLNTSGRVPSIPKPFSILYLFL